MYDHHVGNVLQGWASCNSTFTENVENISKRTTSFACGKLHSFCNSVSTFNWSLQGNLGYYLFVTSVIRYACDHTEYESCYFGAYPSFSQCLLDTMDLFSIIDTTNIVYIPNRHPVEGTLLLLISIINPLHHQVEKQYHSSI